ncbi:hypothetical protein EJ04DRAFT_48280 [Polyplosphaeria fusca]|uniref:Uncharacterized protein n=1 Tax=Polyplosphaeria fusca TaxID=682080 RepID=A0A9P4UVT3_9PLEO|nr:hypothetical protein EJ04DRAFT_48280 [Polyplosphaeria fusca]
MLDRHDERFEACWGIFGLAEYAENQVPGFRLQCCASYPDLYIYQVRSCSTVDLHRMYPRVFIPPSSPREPGSCSTLFPSTLWNPQYPDGRTVDDGFSRPAPSRRTLLPISASPRLPFPFQHSITCLYPTSLIPMCHIPVPSRNPEDLRPPSTTPRQLTYRAYPKCIEPSPRATTKHWIIGHVASKTDDKTKPSAPPRAGGHQGAQKIPLMPRSAKACVCCGPFYPTRYWKSLCIRHCSFLRVQSVMCANLRCMK